MQRFQDLITLSRSETVQGRLKNYLRVLLIWCPVVSVLFIFGFGGLDHLARRFSISMVIAVTVSSFCFFGSWFLTYFYNLYRAQRGLEPKKNGVFWGILTSYPFLLPGLYFGFNFAGQISTATGHVWTPPNFADYSSGIIFGIMVSGLFTLFEVVRESKEAKQISELRLRALENENLKAQISALTAQLNPHLLFNSLNTIASTITTDPESAEEMVVQLSELYRGILKSAKGDMHTLENEILMCKSYLEIERKRFGPRVEYNILVDQAINPKKIKVPVLLLQPLVENAVKHGLGPKREGGMVSIDVKKSGTHLIISVLDNGVGLNNVKSSTGTGTGILNCRSRVKLKYGENSSFSFAGTDKNETAVCIHIPLQDAVCD